MVAQFDDFVFYSSRGVLRRGDREVTLPGTAAEVLRILIERRGQPVDKDYLLQRVWRGQVEESSLSTAISQLRQALGDSRNRARFIRTHHGTGYAFIAEVTLLDVGVEPSPLASSFVLDGGAERPVVLLQGENLLGRDTGRCTVCVPDRRVSRSHARIVIAGKQASIQDLGSTHGTLVRGRLITGWTVLAHGDEIQLGKFGPKMTLRRTDAATETVRS